MNVVWREGVCGAMEAGDIELHVLCTRISEFWSFTFFEKPAELCESKTRILSRHVHVMLSGPPRLRIQSQSRTQLRILASTAFWFRACFKEVLDTIAPL